jgi:hypothetical protein
MKTHFALCASLFLILTGCTTCPFAGQATGKVEHIVLAWLKKPGDVGDQGRVIAAAKELKAGIPQIKSLRVGKVLPSSRAMVDDSFDVALIMTFASKEDMSLYETHPLHVKAVKETLLPLTAKVVVHDFVTE